MKTKRDGIIAMDSREKNILQQKIGDMFLLFFGLRVGSTNAFGWIFILPAWT